MESSTLNTRARSQLYMHEKVPAVKAAARPNTPHMVSFSAAARSWKTLTAEETEMWQRRAFLANQEPQQRWAKKKARQRPRRQQIGGSDGWQRQQEVTAFQMYMHEKVPALKAVASPNTPHSVSFGAASKGWKTLSTEETEMWQRRAAMANQEHQRQREKKEQRMQEQQERPQTQKEEEPQEMEQIAPDQVSVPALTDTGAFTASVWAQPVVDESNENFQAMFAAREAVRQGFSLLLHCSSPPLLPRPLIPFFDFSMPGLTETPWVADCIDRRQWQHL